MKCSQSSPGRGTPASSWAGKLNLFQQLMARWEESHPYNAGHVVRLRGRAEPGLLQAAIEAACRGAGIGALALERRRHRYRYEPVASIELRELEAPVGPQAGLEALAAAVTSELDRPFPEGPNHPVRWLLLDDLRAGEHWVAAVYRHLAADAASMRLLLRRVLNRYGGAPLPEDEEPLDIYPPAAGRRLRHRHRPIGHAGTILRAARTYSRLRRVHRPRERDGAVEGAGWLLAAAPDGLLGRLAAAARAREVTVNDVFLAALCAGIAAITAPRRPPHHHRHGLALGTVVDLREHAGEDLARAFGVHLSQMVTVIEEPDAGDFSDLVRVVASQTAAERSGKRFLEPQWSLLAAACLDRGPGRLLSFAGGRSWYRKVYPLAGGLSNVKLAAAWFGKAGERIADYIRLSPPGPILPLVLAPTTLDGRLNLSLVYRRSSLEPAEASRLIDLVLARLESFSRL